jgi:dipeptidyl aminopeptidase/acylaminoacyl peptidase
MAYDSSNSDKPNTILLRDMTAGTDHVLDDEGRKPGEGGETSISPDGSKVIFSRDCKEGAWPDEPEHRLPCGFLLAAGGGQPEQICQYCTARGFSSDGSMVVLQKYDPAGPDQSRMVLLDLRTRKEQDFLGVSETRLFHGFFSWDDHWVVFKKSQSFRLPQPFAQILIAPVRHNSPTKEADWIAVTDGRHSDDKPQFSADGNTVYFTSTRDGNLCIWAQRLDPVSKHPLGPPFAYEHFHDSAGRAAVLSQQDSDLSVARDKMLINLPQFHSDTWMTQMP